MPRKTGSFWLAALLGGWAVDFLFWGKTPGVSILLWIAWILALGIGLGFFEGVRPSKINSLAGAVHAIHCLRFGILLPVPAGIFLPERVLDLFPHPRLPVGSGKTAG
jgi:hypothetical protein